MCEPLSPPVSFHPHSAPHPWKHVQLYFLTNVTRQGTISKSLQRGAHCLLEVGDGGKCLQSLKPGLDSANNRWGILKSHLPVPQSPYPKGERRTRSCSRAPWSVIVPEVLSPNLSQLWSLSPLGKQRWSKGSLRVLVASSRSHWVTCQMPALSPKSNVIRAEQAAPWRPCISTSSQTVEKERKIPFKLF